MRQTKGSIVCPQCNKLIGVSEPTCPFCGAWRPGLFGWAPKLRQLVGQRLDLILAISIACVVLYAMALLLQPDAISELRGLMSFLSPGTRALYQLGMTGGVAWRLGWWWTLLTAIYLHGSLIHLFFNLMWIRNLGPMSIEVYGPGRSFVLFNISGAVGFLVSNVATGVPTIGASGSVFGLMAALIVYGRRRGSSLMTNQVWQWAIILFVLGLVMPAVNNWAHLGGFAGGWVTAQAMQFDDETRESVWVLLAVLGLVGLTVVGVILSFVMVTGALLT